MNIQRITKSKILLNRINFIIKFEISSENSKKIDFVYSQHGFTPPSDTGAFARKLAPKLNLSVKPFNSLELSRGYEPVLDYRLVKENP